MELIYIGIGLIALALPGAAVALAAFGVE